MTEIEIRDGLKARAIVLISSNPRGKAAIELQAGRHPLTRQQVKNLKNLRAAIGVCEFTAAK